MNTQAESTSTQRPLLAEVICPNCWHRFPPENLLFVARHESLIGDEIAGSDAYRRFLPTRFNVAGDALDAHGLACQQLACPRCHLEIGRPLIEMPPCFISIVGAPASGKSYFLAAMAWEMRSRAPGMGLVFSDGDPGANHELQRYEETLFMSATPDTPVALRKTETTGSDLYRSIMLDGQPQTIPRPFEFTVRPTHDRVDGEGLQRSIILYDNAGEHFLPGQDSTSTPVTLHLAQSEAILFMFDPTQDPRFRKHCHGDDPQLTEGVRPGAAATLIRQELILNEMAARVRRYRAMGQTERHRRPLIMILAKADLWLHHDDFQKEPLIPGSPNSLDLNTITRASNGCRKILSETCPEIVAAAEGFSSRVLYVPVSSLGTSPERVAQDNDVFYGIRPNRIKPRWVTVPMLWALAHRVPRLIHQSNEAAT